MPSTPTTRIRAEKQQTSENLNTWGSLINSALDRFDEAVAGVTSIAIAGASTVLTSSNYAADQARSAVLVLTGTLTANSTVTVPNAEKTYVVVNNTTQGAFSLTLKTAAGSGYALRPGPQAVYCNGTDVFRATPRLDQVPAAAAPVDLGGQKITNLGTPTASTDAVTKAYADLVGAGADTAASANSIAKRDHSANLSTAAFLGGTGSVSAPTYSFTGDTDTGMYRSSNDQISFTTGGLMRMTLSNAGDLFHAQSSTTTPGYLNTTVGHCIRSDGRIFTSADLFSSLNLNTDGTVLLINRSGVNVGSISVTTVGASFNTASDARLKDDIAPVTGALAQLAQLQPKTFRFKSEGKGARPRTGFLAQDVAKICPEAVTGQPDQVGPDGQPVHMMIDHSKLVPLLVATVQELAARVAAWEAKK